MLSKHRGGVNRNPAVSATPATASRTVRLGILPAIAASAGRRLQRSHYIGAQSEKVAMMLLRVCSVMEVVFLEYATLPHAKREEEELLQELKEGE